MSNRSGYSDDLEQWDLIKWRGMVASAIRGKRGQRLIRDLIQALETLPEKVLITEELQDADGDVCSLGAVGLLRGIDLSSLDPEDWDRLAEAFDIAEPLVREIMNENDESIFRNETAQQRWHRMMRWALSNLKPEPTPDTAERPTASRQTKP